LEKNLIKELKQKEAFSAWVKAGKIGTAELATGTGKTFVFFRAVQSMPKGSNILFLAETTVRENTVLKDAIEYKKFYNVDPLKGYKFKFACYQTAYKYNINQFFKNATEENTLICFDEIHDCLTSAYYKFVQNSNLELNKIPRLGLSATIDKKTIYEFQDQQKTKFEILNQFCPIIYSYTLQESIDLKATRQVKFFVLKHELDNYKRNVTVGAGKNQFTVTEQTNYGFLDTAVKKVMFQKAVTPQDKKNKEFRIIQTATRRARFLYSLPSKIEACEELLRHLKGRTLIFGQDSKTLLRLCPTAIVSENKNYIKDLEDFKSGKTNLGASNKILKQGENIPNLNNLVLVAYYSKIKDWTQMVGRVLRDNPEVANVIVFVTSATQEEKWFEQMTQELTEPFTYCPNLKTLLQQL